MSREKLGDFLSDYVTAESVAQRTSISYTIKDWDSDGLDPGIDDLGMDPGTRKALIGHNSSNEPSADAGKSLINDFLHYLTNDLVEYRNYYVVKGGATAAMPLSRKDKDGVPVSLRAASNGGQDVFINESESSGDGMGGTLSQYSDSGYFDDLSGIVSKTNTIIPEDDVAPGPHTGNRLLPSVEGNASPNIIGETFVKSSTADADENSIEGVQSMLQRRNRFNTKSEKAFAPFEATVPVDAARLGRGTKGMGTRTVQPDYGTYNKNADGIFINNDLKNVARSMILKSLGVDWGSSPDSSFNPNEFNYENESVLVTGADVAFNNPTKPKAPRAREAFGSPEGISGGAFEVGGKQSSYGQSYTPDLTFSNQGSAELIRARAGAVIIGMIFACKTVNDTLQSDGTDDMPFLTRSPTHAGQAKRFARKAKIQIFQRYLMPNTRYPISECLNAGCLALFGIKFDDASKAEAIQNEQGTVGRYQTVAEAPGFWHAIGKSMLQKFALSSSSIGDMVQDYKSTQSNLPDLIAEISKSGIIALLRTLVEIGDIVLYSTGGDFGDDESGWATNGIRPFNVDLLVDGPQTRQSKSRSRDGQTSASLAWRSMSSPALYLLPRNVMKAALDMNNLTYGGNPIKGHTATSLLAKSFIDTNTYGGKTTRSRIPTDVARKMEDTLDAEYVPFYFHDVRTNEFIGFHAFLNNLSDGYAANFSSVQGYGRVDPVYIYKDTKRTIGFSFYVAATSKEDFDEMWFKINKLTTMVYPKWTRGTKLSDGEGSSFVQPFSQVISASPLIRLRIGDVVKTNYSRFNLARMFGVGSKAFEIKDDTYTGGGLASGAGNLSKISLFGQSYSDIVEFQLDYIFGSAFGSPLALLPLSGDAGASVADVMIRSVASLAMGFLGGSGIVNPIGASLILQELANPDNPDDMGDLLSTSNPILDAVSEAAQAVAGFSNKAWQGGGGYTSTSYPILKPSVDVGYLCKGDNKNRIRTAGPYRVKVIDKYKRDFDSIKQGFKSNISKGTTNPSGAVIQKTVYEIQFADLDAPKLAGSGKMLVTHEDLMPNPDILFMVRVGTLLDVIGSVAGAAQVAVNEYASKTTGIPASALQLTTTNAAEFVHPRNNPITRAFENSGGRGLAGVIRSLSYDWIDPTVTWETEWGSRAPKVAKVTISFDPIHDLPPGLDHGGYNRAPIYNVGATMNAVSGDYNPDDGLGAKAKYTRATSAASQNLKK